MRLYFKHVIWGVLIRPKKAIEYALNHSTPLSLTLLILLSVFIGDGVLSIYGRYFINNLFITNYFSDRIIQLFLFGLFFSLLYGFSQLMKTKANARDIFYVTLLIGIFLWWVVLIAFIVLLITIGITLYLTKEVYPFPSTEGFISDFANMGVLLPSVMIFSIYPLYILAQMLNRVQKVSIKKSVAVVSLTVLTLMLMVGISKYFEKEQQNLALSLFQTLSKNTDNNASKSTYYMNITDLYEEKKEYEKAIEYYFKALNITEDNVTKSEHYYWIAEDYNKLGEIDKALMYAKESLALTPEDEDSLEQVSELENQRLEMGE